MRWLAKGFCGQASLRGRAVPQGQGSSPPGPGWASGCQEELRLPLQGRYQVQLRPCMGGSMVKWGTTSACTYQWGSSAHRHCQHCPELLLPWLKD